MILEPIRVVADWLASGDTGAASVNTLLPLVGRDGGDPAPPSIADVCDETRDAWVARGRLPKPTPTLPLLAVSLVEASELDPEMMGSYRRGTVTLSVRYFANKSDAVTGTRDAHYTMRAVRRSVRRLMNESAAAVTARTRGTIYVESCTQMTEAPVWDAQDDAISTGALTLRLTIRDQEP